MATIWRKVTVLLIGEQPNRIAPTPTRPSLSDRQLLQQESSIGRSLFDDIIGGHQREFFCLDENTWVWSDQYKDQKQQPRSQTIRYEIHPGGILKIENGGKSYYFLKDHELDDFAQLVQNYRQQVELQLYSHDTVQPQLL